MDAGPQLRVSVYEENDGLYLEHYSSWHFRENVGLYQKYQ